MSWASYDESGALIERGDDATRTVTLADGSTRPYTASESAQADAAVAASARLDDLAERVAALETWRAEQQAADPDQPDAPTWGQLQPPDWWLPGALLTDTDGTVYRNVSGTVLTTPPSGFPGGGLAWRGHLFVVITTPPDPDPGPTRPAGYVGPWSATAEYTVGDVVDRNGRYYRAKVAHGAAYAGTWGPPLPSVWDDIGAV